MSKMLAVGWSVSKLVRDVQKVAVVQCELEKTGLVPMEEKIGKVLLYDVPSELEVLKVDRQDVPLLRWSSWVLW